MKRYLQFIIIFVVIAAIVLLGYLFRRMPNGDLITFGPSEDGSVGFPSPSLGGGGGTGVGGGSAGGPIPDTHPTLTEDKRFGLVANMPVLAYFVDSFGTVAAIQPDGRIAKISPQGKASVVSATIVEGLRAASFSYDGARILAEGGEHLAPSYRIFNMSAGRWGDLPSSIRAPSWAPHESSLVYFRTTSGRSSIETLFVATSTPSPREFTAWSGQGLTLMWISPDQIHIAPKGSGLIADSLWRFTPSSRLFYPVLRDRRGLQTLWSDNGELGLVFTGARNGRGGTLELIDKNGALLQTLTRLTLPSKCAFRDRASRESAMPILYCAIPRDDRSLSTRTLPDAYEKRAFFTSDDFFAIDPSANTITSTFADEDVRVDADNLVVAGGALYFVNRFDGKLYAVRL